MTAQLIFVENAKLYVMLVAGRIHEIQKSTDRHINPHSTCVDCFDVTLGQTHVVEREPYFGSQSKLALSANDTVTLAAWLRDEQMPNASTKAFGNAFERMFPGSMQFRDVLIAAGFIAMESELKRPPHGEELYFIGRVRERDPIGFAELTALTAAKPDH